MSESRHGRDRFFIEGEGLVGDTAPTTARAAAGATPPDFRFSRLGPKGGRSSASLKRKVAKAMTSGVALSNGHVPAGYTYVGQFVDHDLTFDRTKVTLGGAVSPAEMLQGRSPTLDLDSLYGAGPGDSVSQEFYSDDRHLKMGKTVRVGSLQPRVGFDLPRVGDGSKGKPRRALIPDPRNDENLAVAQTHLAMIRFHNRVVDTLPTTVKAHRRFRVARRSTVLHYQWMLRTDFLTRVCDKLVVADVFTHGRKIHEVGADPLSMPTMPVEFSVAAFRFGHSLIRPAYDWNAVFNDGGGTLDLLFGFSGTSGFLGGGRGALPSNWIADWRRMYQFSSIGRNDLKPPPGESNKAQRIDTKLTNPLGELPPGSFGGSDKDFGTMAAHLAFRNLTRSGMVRLATGQQMAALMRGRGVPLTTLTKRQIAGTGQGAVLDALTKAERDAFVTKTPLWFYILREAELNRGRLTGVGARIVVETMHRAMEGSTHSIVRTPDFRPTLGPVKDRFTMMDLLVFAFENDKAKLAPLGD